ncbi:hypothetical protein [Streptococcus sciuri]|uniref:Chemotaxis protein n=1 Tax=Streptococcus sciuri TaxID=2973939 RepID=A0ABT2F6V0_9STRE|nr:hypothetical protein [Streptococcus sciuri]MCS4488177.1 hypothetical protein [Streptococcus sciuri]
MKKYQALTLGLVATASLATYLTYKKGYRIRALCQFSKEETRTASDTLKNIQKNIQIIKEQTALIKQLSQDSQKKWHLFQQETAPKKAEINKRLKHLKTITQH